MRRQDASQRSQRLRHCSTVGGVFGRQRGGSDLGRRQSRPTPGSHAAEGELGLQQGGRERPRRGVGGGARRHGQAGKVRRLGTRAGRGRCRQCGLLVGSDLIRAHHVKWKIFICFGFQFSGLFASGALRYSDEEDRAGEPQLPEMVETAIKMLGKVLHSLSLSWKLEYVLHIQHLSSWMQDSAGFLLVVEGGAIDHAHHNTRIKTALEETVELDEAVRAALDAVAEDTLVIVTADHSHTLAINGFSHRGSDVTGLATARDEVGAFTTSIFMFLKTTVPRVDNLGNLL